MASVFRKKRSSSSLHQQRPEITSPSATTAAAQAFLKKQSEESGLSNAAAAAALRSYTPTPVSEVQTKRMQRRASVSSVGSNASNQRQPFSSQIQRRGSNGSMSQRTFRSPSPGSRNMTPPVPAIPPNVPSLPNSGVPLVPAKSSKRSVDTPTRVTSPPLDANPRPQSMESSRWASQRIPNVPQSPALNRARDAASPTSPSDSPRNINFSRPMSPQMASPTPSSARYSMQSPQPAVSLGLTPEQYRRLEERREASRLQEEDWIERERKRNEAQRLARETVQAKAARPQTNTARSGSATVDGPSASVAARPQSSGGSAPQRISTGLSSISQALPRQRQDTGMIANAKTRPVSMPAAQLVGQSNRASSAPQPRPQLDTQSARVHQQQQQQQQSIAPRVSAADRIPSPTADQIKSFQTRAASLLARPLTDNFTTPTRPLPKSATTNSLLTTDEVKQPHTRSVSSPVSPQRQTVTAGKSRATAESPARSAHFSVAPMLEVMKHNPPPRSVSPVKSALKGSSPRTASPVASHGRDFSDAGSVLSDEGSTQSARKKKSVRVSFEEKPVTVGSAAATNGSPIDNILSPQYRRKFRDDEAFDLSPRPVLPSFGSIRGKRTPEPEDVSSLNDPANKGAEDGEARALRDIAASLEENDSDDEDDIRDGRGMQFRDQSDLLKAPEIAVLPATPRFESENELGAPQGLSQGAASDREGVSSAEDALSAAELHPKIVDVSTKDTDATTDAAKHSSGQLSAEWITSVPTDEVDSDDEDQFSDTVEDPSELENSGGFASLDAIIESPTSEAKEGEKGLSIGEMTENPPSTQPIDDLIPAAAATTADQAVPSPAISPPVEDWDTARAYWSSLSEQQRQALEVKHKPTTADIIQEKTLQSTKIAEKPRGQPNGKPGSDAKPQKSALKQPQSATSTQPTDAVHFRNSLRQSGSMMSSMRGVPERSPSRSNQSTKPKQTIQPRASTEAIALAQATAKSMAAREAKRKATVDAQQQDEQRGRAAKNDRDFRYNMSRSMRDGRAVPTARPVSMDADTSSNRKPIRGSVRHSMDVPSESKSGGFLGLGKSKQKGAKSRKPAGGAVSKFRSRFGDSSDDDSDGGGRSGFRSRFADSDDSDDNGPVKPMNIKLAPVRGIPRKHGQEEGDSTDLEDSDDNENVHQPSSPSREPALPRSSRDRPGTPPASAVLSFGKSPRPAGIEMSKHAPAAPMEDGELSPGSPTTKHGIDQTAEGKALAAGTLRDDNTGKDKRHNRISFGKKSRGGDEPGNGTLGESKWANALGSPNSRPQTPSRGFAKTLRDKESGREKEKRSSMFRRLSAGRGHASAPTTPADGKPSKDEFPFPPPPIPQEYQSPTSPDKQRPNTSDGVGVPSAFGQVNTVGVNDVDRPGMGDRGDSAMTAPSTVQSPGRTRKGKLTKDPIVSSRTGKKKRFQGLRRAFGMDD